MKKCYKCQKTKEISCFNKNKAKHDGLASQCRECGVKISKQSYKDNKKKRNEESLAYYQKNKETINIKNKEYRKNNLTPEKRKIYRNNWLSKHPGRFKLLHKEWREKNKDSCYNYALKRRSYKHKVVFTKLQRTKIIERDNYTCQNCNVKVHDKSTGNWNDEFKAHIDHIIPISRGGDSTPENLRILCRTCNLSKSDKTDIIIKEDGQIALFI